MKRKPKSPPKQATKLSQHIGELRWRFFICVIAFVIGGGVTYFFREEVFQLIQSPLTTPLYYTTPAGSFSFVMRYCALGAVVATIPVLVYQLIMFIRPAFAASISRRRVYLSTLASLVLAAAGVAFGFGFILPASLHFFAGFQMEGLESIISADSYLTLVANILITFALAFQLPLIISFIDHIKPIKPQKLFKMEKWVILISLTLSVFVPFAWDFTTSMLIAAPIIVLYNIAILVVVLQHVPTSKKTYFALPHEQVTHVQPSTTVIPEMPEPPKTAAPQVHISMDNSVASIKIKSYQRHPAAKPQLIDIVVPVRPAPQLVPPQRVTSSQISVPEARGPLISDILPRTKVA